MKIICVAAEKGGVGKTTVTVNLAWALQQGGKKVVVVDIDPQANATLTLLGNAVLPTAGSVSMFKGEEFSISKSESGVDVIHATRELEFVEQMDRGFLIKNFASAARSVKDYDYMIIDTPPSLGGRLRAGLAAADSVISPIQCATYSLKGIQGLLDTIKEVQQQYNPKMKHDAIIANMYRGQLGRHKNVIANLQKDLPALLVMPPINLSVAIEATALQGIPVWNMTSTGGQRAAGKNMKSVIINLLKKVG